MRHSVRLLAAGAIGAAVVASSSAFAAGAGVAPRSAPGVSSTQVSVGAIVSQSGPLAADFKPYLSGVYAYFNYVDKELGGVFGRKVKLAYALDDASSGSADITDARTLVTADHVFAIVGVSTPFFQAHTYLAQANTPTFGYATGNVWGPYKVGSVTKVPWNFFADYGSVLNYNSSIPDFAYIAKQTHSTKVAVVALSYPSSQAECKGAVTGLATYGHTYGFSLAYSNVNESIAQNWTIEAGKIANAHVNMVVSCMDVNSNVALSNALSFRGKTPVQLWLDGYDRKILHSYSGYMKNVYLMLQHIPFEAATAYPTSFGGVNLYLKEMVKYGFGSDEYSDVALMGWESANTFVTGLRAAGANPTQKALIADINKLKLDIGGPAGGVTAPVNWMVAHNSNTSPACETFVKTNGSSFALAFNNGAHPWICFPLTGIANLNAPVKPPTGTPGA